MRILTLFPLLFIFNNIGCSTTQFKAGDKVLHKYFYNNCIGVVTNVYEKDLLIKLFCKYKNDVTSFNMNTNKSDVIKVTDEKGTRVKIKNKLDEFGVITDHHSIFPNLVWVKLDKNGFEEVCNVDELEEYIELINKEDCRWHDFERFEGFNLITDICRKCGERKPVTPW